MIILIYNGIVALLATIFVATSYNFIKWRFSVLNKLPGPIKELNFKSWLLGIFMQIEKEAFMVPHQRWWREAGEDTKLLHYSGLFGRQFVMILDADGIKKVLTSSSRDKFPSYPKGFKYLGRVLGEGLVTLEGANWHKHRRIIQPAFSINFVKTALDTTVPNLVSELISCWSANSDSDIDISSHMAALTLDIIGKVAFSHEFDSMASIRKWSRNPDRVVELKNPIIDGLNACLAPSVTRMILFNLRMSFLERYFLPKLHEANVLFNKAIGSIVQNAQTQSQANGGAKSLLEFMSSDNSHGKLTNNELRNEVKTFFIAGHETTATLCTWAIYCMTKYPSTQKLLFEEVVEADLPEDDLTVNAVDKLEYLECFLKEVLRMFPPVGVTLRLTSKDTTLLGDDIPAKTRIVIPTYLVHRSPMYWTDPLEFKPERWFKNAQKDPKYHHFAYIPFSAGERNCIGQKFSIYEAKLILAMLIREFEFTLSPSLKGQELRLLSFVTIRSEPPILIRAGKRRSC